AAKHASGHGRLDRAVNEIGVRQDGRAENHMIAELVQRLGLLGRFVRREHLHDELAEFFSDCSSDCLGGESRRGFSQSLAQTGTSSQISEISAVIEVGTVVSPTAI